MDVLVVGHNHFDPTWRRAFARTIRHNGVAVRSYAEIEERVFDEWLSLAPKGYTFSEGQTSVWREYIRRDPRRLGRLKAEIAAGRLTVMCAGETVQDTNLPTAEGLIRNFVVAWPQYGELCGEDHPGLKLGWLEDAFGNSPNYPQILLGVGCEVACYLTYRSCPEEIWVGIDGSKIACFDHLPRGGIGGVVKHPPCIHCQGEGCDECGQSGIRWIPQLFADQAAEAIERLAGQGDPAPYLMVGGEETVPDACVLKAVRDAHEKHGISVRWARLDEVYERDRERLQEVVSRRDETPSPDLNPAMPGCFVSRIRLKQRVRDLSHRLVATESVLANEAWLAGQPRQQPAQLDEAWRRVVFCQFHDAMTGTLLDGCCDELTDMLDEAENLLGPKPAMPAQQEVFRPAASQGVRRLGELAVHYDLRGIAAVLTDGVDLHGQVVFNPCLEPFRIGELTLESDCGDAWGQRIPPLGHSSLRPLGEFNHSVEESIAALRWIGRYQGGHRKVRKLEWTVTVRASADGKRLDFVTEVDWDTESKRLRVVFPVASDDPNAEYEVPFGYVERAYDASKVDYSQWHAHQNEYAIQNWACKSLETGGSVALITRGLPCARWQPGWFDLSLLRSPEWEFCQVEASHYEFWDNDGLRDTGRHTFEYSVWPSTRPLSALELTRLGLEMNRAGFAPPPFEVEGPVVVSAWKPAQDGTAWVLRLSNPSGVAADVRLDFGSARRVTVADLLERPTGSEGSAAVSWAGSIHRFGVLTLRIR